MLSSGFSTYESIELDSVNGTCTITITRTSIDEEGNEVTETRTHITQAADERDCNVRASFTLRAYQTGAIKF
jgi:DUF4097 and DUF4098 domain-containing protein YvlB